MASTRSETRAEHPTMAKTARTKAGSAPKPARIAYPDVEPKSRAAWRAWLAANHETSIGVWLVNHKKGSGQPSLRYDDIVEECLCFGWVDSLVNKLDDERSRLLCTPRKPKSAWSRPNKERIERLVAGGAMAPRGLRRGARQGERNVEHARRRRGPRRSRRPRPRARRPPRCS
jgi:uncharacterized protein YdeI (YjbR/CyaY-like superfamily)